MKGIRRPERIARPLAGLARRGIEVVLGEVRIDPERREAVVDGVVHRADHLIVALGAEFAFDAVPGLAAAGHTFCTLDGAERLRGALDELRAGRVLLVTAAPAYKCPAAPYEAAMLIDATMRRRGLRGSGLVDHSGWVRVDRHTLATRFPGVYAVGDVTLIPLAMGKPLPRAGVFAHAQAEAVARNIAAVVAGRTPAARFDGHGACFIETGAGRAGYGAGDFYAEPAPQVSVRPPGRLWHLGKALFEQQVLRTWL